MAESKIGPIVGVILAGGLAQRMGGGDKRACIMSPAPPSWRG
jgi:molybdopterin-guanine dinucleotide biosynthesis protein A